MNAPLPPPTVLRRLGRVDYLPTWEAMKRFTRERQQDTPDEIWLLEHPPVFTQGLAGKAEHVLRDIGVPIVPIDRGGQVTYHGPGQVVAYVLLDLRRRGWTVKAMVHRLEQVVIDLLADYGIEAERRAGAPGVYVGDAKIASLGLKIRQGCSYHGLAVNVDMDLAPFAAINPCGYAGLAVTQMSALCNERDADTVAENLGRHLLEMS